MVNNDLLIVVPARLNSSRFPNKILKKIDGIPMMRRVLDVCGRCFGKEKVITCVDDKKVADLSEKWGYKSVLTSKKCNSGSLRISSVIEFLINDLTNGDFSKLNTISKQKILKEKLILNVQADQPFLEENILTSIAKLFFNKKYYPDVITPIYPLSKEEIHDPNIVKVIVSSKGRAIYFSRQAIPYIRDCASTEWYKKTTFWGHIGIYGYRADVISSWGDYFSPLEDLEKLEQLRLIDAGLNVETINVKKRVFSVDTYDQFEEANEIVKRENFNH